MKKLLSFVISFISFGVCLAQTPQANLNLSVTPVSAQPGQTITILGTLSMTPSTQVAPAGLMFQFVLPSGWAAPTASTLDPSQAGKKLTCNGAVAPAPTLCIVAMDVPSGQIGPMPVGNVATFTFLVPAVAGPQVFALTNLSAALQSGDPIAIASMGTTFTAIASPFDLNGDGSITVADVLIIFHEVLTQSCTHDPAGTGICNYQQIGVEINAWDKNGRKP